MEVGEIMRRKIHTVTPRSSIRFAAKKMSRYHIGSLLVVSSDVEVQGIITETEIVKAFGDGKNPKTDVRDIIHKKVATVRVHDTLETAAKIMSKNKIKWLPVVEKKRCVGIVTATDLIKYEEHLLDRLAVLFLLPQKTTQGG